VGGFSPTNSSELDEQEATPMTWEPRDVSEQTWARRQRQCLVAPGTHGLPRSSWSSMVESLCDEQYPEQKVIVVMLLNANDLDPERNLEQVESLLG
jgi:hypothetical protein